MNVLALYDKYASFMMKRLVDIVYYVTTTRKNHERTTTIKFTKKKWPGKKGGLVTDSYMIRDKLVTTLVWHVNERGLYGVFTLPDKETDTKTDKNGLYRIYHYLCPCRCRAVWMHH